MRFTYTSGSKPLEGYTIKRGVGIGGFGEVYFAVTDAGKEVALKRVQRNLEVEIRGVSQCLNLKHPNLVDLYDIRYDDQGGAWVVMEFITGESLKDVIDRNPNGLPREDVSHWFLGICNGVGYLHDHGIVHRDLKPGNIFSDQGEIKIGDYGLSKFIAASRRSGQTESVGTFHYMAPEIGKGSYGKEIDIYALGIILYEMLTGKVPFDGESSQEIIMRHLTEDPDVSQLAQPFRNVVDRAMTKDPELRYTHVSQMVEELGSALRPGAKTIVTATIAPAATVVDKVLYIGDEPPPREMVFGPLRQRGPSIPQVALHPVRRPLPQPTTPRQPVSQAVAQSAERAASWWQGSILNTGLKVSIVVVLIAVAIMNPWLLIPLAIAALLIYTVYGGIWLIGSSMRSQPPATSGIRMRSWQEMVRENLRAKPVGTRIGELTGGYFAAAILSGLISVALIAGVDQFNPDMTTLSLYTWLAISSTLGSWAVLTVGKFCEGVESDAWRRRAVLLALGLGLGAAAWGLSDRVLLVDLQSAAHTWNVESAFSNVDANLLTRFLVFFAAVFAIPGWWKQTDPLRRSRVNLFTLGWCVLWAGLVSLLWPFPQPWGLMLAATVSLSTQLAAPWMTSKERDTAKKEFRRA